MTSNTIIYEPTASTTEDFIKMYVLNNPYIDSERAIEYLNKISNTSYRTAWTDYQSQFRTTKLVYVQNSLIIGELYYNRGFSAPQIFNLIPNRKGTVCSLERAIQSLFRPRTGDEQKLFKRMTYSCNRFLNRKNMKIVGAESEIIRMYLDGMSRSMIAKEFNVNIDSIESILYEANCVNVITEKYTKYCADIRSLEGNMRRTNEQKSQSIIKMRLTRLRNNSATHQRIKTLKTIREKYNDESITNISHVSSIHEKQQRYRYVQYLFKTGEAINVQGYEPRALTELEQDYTINDIDNRRRIRYTCKDTSSTKYYFADIYVKPIDLIIEVKSIWTIKKYANKNFSILLHMIETNTNFEFWVYSKKSKLVIKTISDLIDFCQYCPLFIRPYLT